MKAALMEGLARWTPAPVPGAQRVEVPRIEPQTLVFAPAVTDAPAPQRYLAWDVLDRAAVAMGSNTRPDFERRLGELRRSVATGGAQALIVQPIAPTQEPADKDGEPG